MKQLLIWPVLAMLPGLAAAGTTLIELETLPTRMVHEVAELTPLAVTTDGTAAVLQLALESGAVVPPHATQSGLRLLTVLSGEMSWGDGSTIDESQEKIYGPGSVLALPSGVEHWLAARQGPVTIQLVLLNNETLVPEIEDQMK